MTHTSPISLAREQIHILEGQLTGIYDGDPESIHDARVASRRLREIVPLIDADVSPAIEAEVKQMGRCLGRIRDLDVESALLLRIEQRVPATAGVTAIARARIVPLRSRKLRKAIKRLEELDLAGLAKRTYLRPPSWRQRLVLTPPWTLRLRAHTADRVNGVRTAVTHGTGVYFPRRTHGTRIALKKLRYVVEVAAASGTWRPPRLLKDLRKFQSLLGEIHDAETLLGSVAELVADTNVSARDVDLVRQVLEGEIAGLHAQYVAGREAVLAVCDACERFAGDDRVQSRRLITAGSVLAASVATLAIPAALGRLAPRGSRAAALFSRVS